MGTHLPGKWEMLLLGLARNCLHPICRRRHHGAHSGKEQKLLPGKQFNLWSTLGGWKAGLALAPQLVGWVDFSGSERIPTEEFQRRCKGSSFERGGSEKDSSRKITGSILTQGQNVTLISSATVLCSVKVGSLRKTGAPIRGLPSGICGPYPRMAIKNSIVLVAVFQRVGERARLEWSLLAPVRSEWLGEEGAGKFSHRDINSACGREKGQ